MSVIYVCECDICVCVGGGGEGRVSGIAINGVKILATAAKSLSTIYKRQNVGTT